MTLEEFGKQEGLRFVILFGSRAEGKAGEKSDYDVAVLFRDPEKFMRKYTETLFAVSEQLRVPAECVDLSNLGTGNILLRYEATRAGILIYGDPEEYLNYQCFAYREYIDAGSLFELERTLIDKRQEYLRQLVSSI